MTKRLCRSTSYDACRDPAKRDSTVAACSGPMPSYHRLSSDAERAMTYCSPDKADVFPPLNLILSPPSEAAPQDSKSPISTRRSSRRLHPPLYNSRAMGQSTSENRLPPAALLGSPMQCAMPKSTNLVSIQKRSIKGPFKDPSMLHQRSLEDPSGCVEDLCKSHRRCIRDPPKICQ